MQHTQPINDLTRRAFMGRIAGGLGMAALAGLLGEDAQGQGKSVGLSPGDSINASFTGPSETCHLPMYGRWPFAFRIFRLQAQAS